MTAAVGVTNFLDRLYEKGARLIADFSGNVKKFATEQPTKFRRAVALSGLAMLFVLAMNVFFGPLAIDISDHAARSVYGDKFAAAKDKVQTPADKAALWMLGSCMSRNQWVSSRTGQHLMLDRAEQTCLGQAIAQVALTGTPDQVRDVVTRYERLGFKVDPELQEVIGQ